MFIKHDKADFEAFRCQVYIYYTLLATYSNTIKVQKHTVYNHYNKTYIISEVFARRQCCCGCSSIYVNKIVFKLKIHKLVINYIFRSVGQNIQP